jgi:hypothetical protein
MKILAGLLLSVSSVATAAPVQDDDIWTQDQCRAVAAQCIANPGGFGTPNECWSYFAGPHCPDTGSSEPPPNNYTPLPDVCYVWANTTTCDLRPQ